jgi:hypothetical protein
MLYNIVQIRLYSTGYIDYFNIILIINGRMSLFLTVPIYAAPQEMRTIWNDFIL